jgi:hypothetical protein
MNLIKYYFKMKEKILLDFDFSQNEPDKKIQNEEINQEDIFCLESKGLEDMLKDINCQKYYFYLKDFSIEEISVWSGEDWEKMNQIPFIDAQKIQIILKLFN